MIFTITFSNVGLQTFASEVDGIDTLSGFPVVLLKDLGQDGVLVKNSKLAKEMKIPRSHFKRAVKDTAWKKNAWVVNSAGIYGKIEGTYEGDLVRVRQYYLGKKTDAYLMELKENFRFTNGPQKLSFPSNEPCWVNEKVSDLKYLWRFLRL